jgi:predicted transcriptional regulator
MQVLVAKKKVIDGLKGLGVDLSRFQIAPMEEEPIWVENPEPYLISTG